MRFTLFQCARGILFTLAACGALHAQCVPGGLAVVVPKGSPTDSLSMAQLRKLVIGDVHTWPDKNKVTLVSADQEGATFKCMLAAVTRMTTQEYHKYLLSAEFRGEEPLRVKATDSAMNVIKTVATSAGSFSFMDASSLGTLGGSIKILSINGKKPGEPGYPL